LFDFDFDMAVSGVNDGPIWATTLYSGTVAAAIEGRFQLPPWPYRCAPSPEAPGTLRPGRSWHSES
jgi:hypothetical protein